MTGTSRKNILPVMVLFFLAAASPEAQETTLEQVPALRERAVEMQIISRIIEQNQQVVWNSENTKLTIPGRPVGIRLVGSGIVVAAQFTPFLRQNGKHTLVTQSQVWINVPNEGMSYHTTMQTIPFEYREQIYFFPLGSIGEDEGPQIEIQIVMEPYQNSSSDPRRTRDRVSSP
jgi:hypothetical protein